MTYKVKSFCSLQGKDFDEKVVEREFTTKWKPIFKLMEQYPGFYSSEVADKSFVQSSFADATAFLKTRVWYVWNRVKDDRIFSAYAIGTLE